MLVLYGDSVGMEVSAAGAMMAAGGRLSGLGAGQVGPPGERAVGRD